MIFKILSIVGARPQFIKAAVLTRLFSEHPSFREILVHTGQHVDANMSDIFFKELGIPKPHYHLGLSGLSHGAMTGRMLEKLEEIMMVEKPDLVLIYGDTNSTLAGALAASKCHIPVAHVEAGLRSFNRKMPEEVNRLLSDHMSSLLFCPTQRAIANLYGEGITQGVYHTGDIMYDATLFVIQGVSKATVSSYGLEENNYVLFTLHRQENTDDCDRLQSFLDYAELYSKDHHVKILWPVHPRTKQRLRGIDTGTFQMIDPVGYQDMQNFLHYSHSILTDSGGLQKEAYFHNKLCVTLRDETEWAETIEAGWNRLWLDKDYKTPKRPIPDYGNGKAGEKIICRIEDYLISPNAHV